MEIRNGYGTTGARVAGPVHVGDPLTLMILMRSAWGKLFFIICQAVLIIIFFVVVAGKSYILLLCF